MKANLVLVRAKKAGLIAGRLNYGALFIEPKAQITNGELTALIMRYLRLKD